MANDIQKSLSSLDATEFGDSKDRYNVELAERLLLVDLYIVRKVLLQTSALKSVRGDGKLSSIAIIAMMMMICGVKCSFGYRWWIPAWEFLCKKITLQMRVSPLTVLPFLMPCLSHWQQCGAGAVI